MTLKYNLNKDKQKKLKNLYNLIITNQKKKIFVTTLIAYFIRSVLFGTIIGPETLFKSIFTLKRSDNKKK